MMIMNLCEIIMGLIVRMSARCEDDVILLSCLRNKELMDFLHTMIEQIAIRILLALSMC